MNKECVGCIKRKTPYCPTSMECMDTEDMPYFRNRIMLLEENQKLKDNWNKLKKDLELVVNYGLGDESSKWDKIYGEYAKSTLKFMQELEQRSDSNGQ